MTEETIEDLFKSINEEYENYCTSKQKNKDCTNIKQKIMEYVYKAFGRSKYAQYIEYLSKELCIAVNKCLEKYETYSKKDKVIFSKFVWHHITHYVITGSKKEEIEKEKNYSFSPIETLSNTTRAKIQKLKKFIKLYEQEHFREPNFNNQIIKNWFMEQLGWTEKQLQAIIKYMNFQNVSINAENDNDEKQCLETVLDDKSELSPEKTCEQFLILNNCQLIWEQEKSNKKKRYISALFTRLCLEQSRVLIKSLTDNQLLEYTILDKDLLVQYSSIKHLWTQKEIANKLTIDDGYASRIIKDFLKKVKEII